ncbi:MAG: MaoC family dehydratase N-terminal domain-containing protein [bacterium]
MSVQIDRDIVGQEFDRTTFAPVSAEQIFAYALSTGETDARWTQPAPDMVAPPTFTLSLRGKHFMPKNMPAHLGRNGFDAGKDIEFGAAIRPGDVLTAVATVHDVYEKTGRTGSMTFIVFRTTVTNQAEAMVAIIDQKMMFR